MRLTDKKYIYFPLLMLLSAQAGAVEDLQPPTTGQEEMQESFLLGHSFFKDAKITGSVDYFQRRRDRRDLDDNNKYRRNLDHTTLHSSINFDSGFFNDVIGFNLGFYGNTDLRNKAAPDHEMNFEPWRDPWHPNWSRQDPNGGASYSRAHFKFRYSNFWAKLGYFQPSGPGILGVNWSISPGTYRGAEIGGDFDTEYGKLSTAIAIVDKYKAPWFKRQYRFYQNDGETKVNYVYSLGVRYALKNNLTFDVAFGQSEGYFTNGHVKVSYHTPVKSGNLNLAYQFYAVDDSDNSGSINDNFDSLSYQHVLRSGYHIDAWTFTAEFSYTAAPMSNANQLGYFVYRPASPFGSSGGAYDIWWNARSDWNHDKEKAIFVKVDRTLNDLGLRGWSAGVSYAHGWGGRAFGVDETLREHAFNADITYKVPSGRFKDTSLNIHWTTYKNKTNQRSWEGFKNAFQDEKDIKIFLTMPFSIK